MKQLIEKEEFIFYLYKDDATNELQLSVPISDPHPGFDVIYMLTIEEQKLYLKNGAEALRERVNDMNLNYKNYTLVSWR